MLLLRIRDGSQVREMSIDEGGEKQVGARLRLKNTSDMSEEGGGGVFRGMWRCRALLRSKRARLTGRQANHRRSVPAACILDNVPRLDCEDCEDGGVRA